MSDVRFAKVCSNTCNPNARGKFLVLALPWNFAFSWSTWFLTRDAHVFQAWCGMANVAIPTARFTPPRLEFALNPISIGTVWNPSCIRSDRFLSKPYQNNFNFQDSKQHQLNGPRHHFLLWEEKISRPLQWLGELIMLQLACPCGRCSKTGIFGNQILRHQFRGRMDLSENKGLPNVMASYHVFK